MDEHAWRDRLIELDEEHVLTIEAPAAWPEAAVMGAMAEGLAVSAGTDRVSLREGLDAVARRFASPEDAAFLAACLAKRRIAFDPATARGEFSACLMRWPGASGDAPSDASDATEFEALAAAQRILRGGGKLGVLGSPSPAALDTLDAFARLCASPSDPHESVLITPVGEHATPLLAAEPARAHSAAALAAGARVLDTHLADVAVEAVRSGLDATCDAVARKARAARIAGAPDEDLRAAL